MNFEGNELTLSKLSLVIVSDLESRKITDVWSYPNGDALMHSRMELPFVYSQNAVMGVSFHFRLIFKTLRETKPYLVPLIYKAMTFS